MIWYHLYYIIRTCMIELDSFCLQSLLLLDITSATDSFSSQKFFFAAFSFQSNLKMFSLFSTKSYFRLHFIYIYLCNWSKIKQLKWKTLHFQKNKHIPKNRLNVMWIWMLLEWNKLKQSSYYFSISVLMLNLCWTWRPLILKLIIHLRFLRPYEIKFLIW